jgi:hypothetical protein
MDFEPECTFHEALDCRLGNPKPDATEVVAKKFEAFPGPAGLPSRVSSGPSVSLPGSTNFEDNAAVAAWKRPFAGRRAGIRL